MTAPRRITAQHAAMLEQARSFMADADTLYGPLLDAVLDAVRAFLDAVRAAVLGRTDAAPDPDQFPADAEWLDIVHDRLDPLIGEAFEAAYTAALEQATGPELDGTDLFRTEPFVRNHIDTVESRLRDWPAAVFEEIRHELREAYDGNETTDQMRDRVGAVLGIDAVSRELRGKIVDLRARIAQKPPHNEMRLLKANLAALKRDVREEDRLWQWRANRIARTELTAAVNGGQYRAHITLAAAEGAEPRKQWMATSDERTRHSHAAANGQVRDLSRPFTIGGAPLMFPGDPTGPPGETINCRCALVIVPPGTEPVPLYPVGDVTDEAGALAAAMMEANMPADVMHATGANPFTALIRARQTAEQPSALPAPPRPVPDGWRGVLVPLDTLSCDGRVVASPSGELTTRPLPLPLLAQEQLAQGHDGAVVVGLIDRAWVQDGAVWGEGRFDLEDEAGRLWARRLGDGFAGWVSVDLDEATITEMGVDDAGNLYQLADTDPAVRAPDDDRQIVLRADPWRLMSATLLSQQAFTDARVTGLTGYTGPGTGTEIVQAAAPPPLPPRDGADDGAEDVWVPSVGDRVIVDAGDASGPGEVTAVDTQDGPVMVTVLLDAGGEVTVDLTEVVPETPGLPVTDQAGLIRSAFGRKRLVRSLAASGGGVLAPASEWFADPRLDAPTPLTVDGNRVYGHLALWSSCHTGIPDVCVSPPPSGSNYSVFHTGEVLCADGTLVPVGKITLGTGHADMQDGFQAALEHYDNTGTAVAVVRAYEDEHGIAVAGALCPGVTDYEIAALRRSPLSGDWRRIGGHMELVAALCVNVPGFPVPRLTASVGELGTQTSLVAAGRVPVRTGRAGATPKLTEVVFDSDQWARSLASSAVDEYLRRNQRRDAVIKRMTASTGTVWGQTRAAVAAARLRRDGTEQVIERAAAGHGYQGRKGNHGGL